ncbi:MAG: hypothetical protein JRJ51_02985 [Deltaproteobacteria bacterium]|nr:hypothetical protein [Deltaproteobacteria bacterium]
MLRVISGAHHFDMAPGPCHMIAAPEEAPPFSVDGVVMEEDTFLVLSAPKTVRPGREPLIRIMTRVIETRPREPGTVIVKGKKPLQLLAIVHDLNQDPTWKETWISDALRGVLKIAEERRLHSIALPMLGTVHGTFDGQKFMLLLGSALKDIHPAQLKRIWMIIPSGTRLQTLEVLKSALNTR